MMKGKTDEADALRKSVEAKQDKVIKAAEKEAEGIKATISDKYYAKRDKKLDALAKEMEKSNAKGKK
ncbi:MAG: hypothetical protein ACK5MQ_06330 [Pikeienuella sp.]